jgi:hypothetical protein
MKKLILLVVFIAFVTSCETIYYTGSFVTSLKKVEASEVGKPVIKPITDGNETKYSYSDSIINIVWFVGNTELDFTITNKSNKSIKIVWDDAAYVDPSGQSHRVMHKGIKYTDRNNPTAPTVVVKGTTLTDMLVPTDKVTYFDGYYSSGWNTAPLLPTIGTSIEQLKQASDQVVGKNVSVLLPIETGVGRKEYLFTFKIDYFQMHINNYAS